MNKEHRRITRFYSSVSAVTAFVTQPVPALDEVIVIPLHYALCARLARAKGVPITSLPWKELRKIIWYGAGARLVANFSLGLVPVAGMFSNAVTALVLTEFLGRYLETALYRPSDPLPEITMDGLKTMFATAFRRDAEEAKRRREASQNASDPTNARPRRSAEAAAGEAPR